MIVRFNISGIIKFVQLKFINCSQRKFEAIIVNVCVCVSLCKIFGIYSVSVPRSLVSIKFLWPPGANFLHCNVLYNNG